MTEELNGSVEPSENKLMKALGHWYQVFHYDI